MCRDLIYGKWAEFAIHRGREQSTWTPFLNYCLSGVACTSVASGAVVLSQPESSLRRSGMALPAHRPLSAPYVHVPSWRLFCSSLQHIHTLTTHKLAPSHARRSNHAHPQIDDLHKPCITISTNSFAKPGHTTPTCPARAIRTITDTSKCFKRGLFSMSNVCYTPLYWANLIR